MKRYVITFKLIKEAEIDCTYHTVEWKGMHMGDAVEGFRKGAWIVDLLDESLGMEILSCVLLK